MCGLVFAGGKTCLTSAELERFEQMLDFDRLRGDHSTGVCAVFHPFNGDWSVKVAKEAVPGDVFVRSQVWENVSSIASRSGVGSFYRQMPKAIFGHNRFATRGEVNSRNAHPFHHGKIILAHNGTLVNQSLLPDHQQFQVDSENIAYSIDQIGFEETLKRLNGAFTLIWLNTEEKTMNIIRNDQRPFYLIQTPVGDWYGSSEKGLVEWIISRNKGTKPENFKRAFEIEVGVQYIFDVSNGCVLKEERKHELPTFRGYYSGYSSGYSQATASYEKEAEDWYKSRENRHATGNGTGTKETSALSLESPLEEKRQEANDLLRQHKVRALMGDVIEFEAFSFKPYPLKPENGLMQCWLPTMDEYIEVQVHCVPAEMFNPNREYRGVIKSVYVHNYVLTIIAQLVDEKEEEEEEDLSTFLDSIHDDNDIPELVKTNRTGEAFTEKAWRHSKHNVCAMCSDPIPFSDVPLSVIENDYCFCGTCDDAAKARREETKVGAGAISRVWCSNCEVEHDPSIVKGTAAAAAYRALDTGCQWRKMHLSAAEKRVADLAKPSRPILSITKKEKKSALCSACGTDLPLEFMSEKEDLCNSCYTRFHQATEVRVIPKLSLVDSGKGKTKTLMNKMIVSKENWEKMNTCRRCSTKIQWIDAESCDFWGEAPICFDCSYELNNSLLNK